MKTKEELKQIETNVDFLLSLYDKANMLGDGKMKERLQERIDHEMAKLDENEIRVNSMEIQ